MNIQSKLEVHNSIDQSHSIDAIDNDGLSYAEHSRMMGDRTRINLQTKKQSFENFYSFKMECTN